MKYVSAALFLAAFAFGGALLLRAYAFPAPVDAARVSKARPVASFLKLDEGVLADLSVLAPYAPMPAATGSQLGKGALLGAPSKADYNF